jgi:hypothetical protein
MRALLSVLVCGVVLTACAPEAKPRKDQIQNQPMDSGAQPAGKKPTGAEGLDCPAFGVKDPLWINNHKSTAGALPKGWTTYTVWQWADHGDFPGDQNVIKQALYEGMLAK